MQKHWFFAVWWACARISRCVPPQSSPVLVCGAIRPQFTPLDRAQTHRTPNLAVIIPKEKTGFLGIITVFFLRPQHKMPPHIRTPRGVEGTISTTLGETNDFCSRATGRTAPICRVAQRSRFSKCDFSPTNDAYSSGRPQCQSHRAPHKGGQPRPML